MKKTLIIPIVAALALIIPIVVDSVSSQDQSAFLNIVFSEVYYDSNGPDSREEYIELYNPNNEEVDISGYSISDNSGSYTIDDATMAPYSFLILARDDQGFLFKWEKAADITDLTLSLDNDGDNLDMEDRSGVFIDRVAWEGGEDGSFASWDLIAESGECIRRKNVYIGSSSSDAWNSYSTPDPKNQDDLTGVADLAPTASIVKSDDQLLIGEDLILYGDGSFDPDSTDNDLDYMWDLGDGMTDENRVVTHSYREPGNYFISLVVTDQDNLKDEARVYVSVIERPDVIENGIEDREEPDEPVDGDGAPRLESGDDEQIVDPEDRTEAVLAAFIVVLIAVILFVVILIVISLRRK